MEETFSGINFSQKLIPRNIVKDIIRKSLFLQNISLYVVHESLFSSNFLNKGVCDFFLHRALK